MSWPRTMCLDGSVSKNKRTTRTSPFAATVSAACVSITEIFMVLKFIEPEVIDPQVYRMYNIPVEQCGS